MSTESYVPVSRGLRGHLPKLSGNAVKLYLELLLSATFSGPRKGQVATTFAELGRNLRMHRQTVFKAAQKLRPYFVQWEGAKNQYDTTIFTVQKYKSVKDFAVSRTTDGEVTASDLPVEKSLRRGDSEVTAPSAIDSSDSGLTVPKKLKKPEKETAASSLHLQEDSVWNFLAINPCGPPSFRSLLENRWRARTREKTSVFIGDTIDAWEAAEGEKLRRVPALFRCLAELRRKDRLEWQPAVQTPIPIHTFSAEEIPA